MLSLLQAENVATIEKASIPFEAGLNILTGETGAGKSILIDAISAVTGAKTSRELIRTGADHAGVSALFTQVSEETQALLTSLGLPTEPDGSLLLRRRLGRDGKNACFVNGSPVTVSMLRQISLPLITIHGQRDSGALLENENHMGFLDAFAQNGAEREAMAQVFERLRQTLEQRKALDMDEAYKARRLDLLHFQIGELAAADVKPGEIAALRHKRSFLKNAKKVTDALLRALVSLLGDGETPGADALLSDAAGDILSVSEVAKGLDAVAASVENARDAALDAASVLDDVLSQLASGEDRLEDVEERLDLLYRLSKKYGQTEEEMLRFLDDARQELENITFSEEKLAALDEACKELRAQARSAAEALTNTRAEAVGRLAAKVEGELRFLNMPNARFSVQVGQADLSAAGADEVVFLFSANPGEAPKPLGKVASGGELSRVMLSLVNVLDSAGGASALIFDEIDQGVSGSAAGKIALRLKQLSSRAQVLCVTHLAQIAAYADEHKYISKTVKDGRTFTDVTSLGPEERARELAHMTYGESFTERQLESAAEMIKAAEVQKNKK